MDNADIVIVGAGSAGCVLAARLSENPDLKVVLIEAGGKDDNPWIHVPAGLLKILNQKPWDWCLYSGPEPHMHGRRIRVPRGRMLGGTSSMNGMIYMRGHPFDYDAWRDGGAEGWGWSDVLPYFKKSEDQSRGESRLHGVGGPLRVSDIAHDRLSDAFVKACLADGDLATDDFNGPTNAGAGYYQLNTRRARRASTARAFLAPALKRPNLTVLTDAHATKLTFEGRTCTGVRFVRDGTEQWIGARETIVASGSYLSPALLQRSGIGPADLLRRHGGEMVAERGGVGENLQDHLHTRVGYKTRILTVNNIAHSPLLQAWEAAKYAIKYPGFLSYGIFRAGLFTKSSYEEDRPDLQMLFGLVSYDELEGPPHDFPGCSINVVQLRPTSRGSVRIQSTDPFQEPLIVSNFLETDYDKRVMIAAVRKARRIGQQAALAPFFKEEFQPGRQAQSDEDILEHVRTTALTVHHPVGTCRMGADADSVVDLRLKVRGVDGLRVVDASVMPTIVSGNTNAPTIMIAEKAAVMIGEDMKALQRA